jgi:hypothetical protein
METPSYPSIAPWAPVLAALRTRTLTDDMPIWDELLRYQVELIQHLAQEGLELLLDRQEGFACLKQLALDETGRTIGLMRRTPIPYDLSLVCILLREWLEEFDISASESRQLYISQRQLQERIELFFPEQHNQLKLLRDLNALIDKVEKLGFLSPVKSEGSETTYQVMRVIKAWITPEQLEAFYQQQEEYAKSLESESR